MLREVDDSAYATAILETIDLPVLALDANLTVEVANAAFFHAFQVTPEETIGRRFWELGSDQWDAPELRRWLTEVLERDNSTEYFRVARVFDGLSRVLRFNARWIRRPDARNSILLTISDETEREARLHDASPQFEFARKVIDGAREALVILHTDLRVHAVNKPFSDLFMIDRKEAEGQLIYEIGDGQWKDPELRRLLEDVLARERSFDDCEVHHVLESIGPRAMLLNGRCLDNMIVLSIRDVTRERESEKACQDREKRLSDSDERLLFALEAGRAIGAWDWQVRENLVRTDANFARQYGIPADMAEQGVPVARFIEGIHQDDRDRVWAAIRHALESGEDYTEEYRLAGGPAGEIRWVLARGRCRRDQNGEPHRFPGVVVDITERKAAEAQLAADQELIAQQFAELEALYAEAPLGLALLDHDLRFVRINAALAEINGFPEETHIGQRAWDLLPSLRETAEPALRHVLDTGTPLRDVIIKGETASRPGVVRAWREHFYPLRRSDGSVQGVGIVCEEITERLAAERAIAENEAMLEIVTGSLDAFVYAKDRDGRYLMVNDKLCRLIGRMREDIIGKTDADLFDMEYATNFRRNDRIVVESAETVTAEEAACDEDGGRRVYYSVKSPLRDTTGEISGIVGVSTDLTELRRAEAALRESEARLAAVTRYAPVGIGLCDRDGRWIFKNPALAGIDGELIPSRDAGELGRWQAFDETGRSLPPEEWPGARALRGETVMPGVEFRSHIGGEDRWLRISSAPVMSGSEVEHAVITWEDITERKQAETQRDFLMREVNHRSKNMLSVVQAIASATAGTEGRDFAAKFEQRIQALAANQDLLVSRDWQGVDLAELVRAQLAHLEDLLDRQITLNGHRVLISAAASQALGMALHELATNASKYGALSTLEGRVQIAWDFPTDKEGKRSFRLRWSESGGPLVTPPAEQGFGSTVISCMTQINLQSEVSLDYAPSGLIWQLECPIERLIVETSPEEYDGPVQDRSSVTRPAAEATRDGGYRILVVEDEPLVALGIAETLKNAGLGVVGPAGSVDEAFALLACERCDAAILDVTLNNETAEPIAQKLTREGKPLIVVSAYLQRQLPPDLRDAPLLGKPIRSRALIAELDRLLRTAGNRSDQH